MNSLSSIAWRRFRRNVLAMTGGAVILFALIVAILGYLIMPDSTPMANEQIPELATKKPGFSILILKVRKNEQGCETGFFHKILYGEISNYYPVPVYKYHFEDSRIIEETYTGDEVNNGEIKSYSLADVIYPLAPGDTSVTATGNELTFKDINGTIHTAPISLLRNIVESNNLVHRTYWLGTDRFGRDMLSRMMAGTRVSLSVGFIAVVISLLIGILLGSIAGFFRGIADDIIQWFITVVWSIPLLLLVIAITLVMGKGFWQVFVAVGLAIWVEVARIVRGQILSIREKDYVEACRALGFSSARTIFRHILPNIMGPVIVISASNFASAILIEAGLSFLGIGAQPPVPSWGGMIKDHYGYIILDQPWLAIIPGIAIMLIVLAFTLVGNGLRDALDVRLNLRE